jgi:hypothetical protein
MRLPSALANGRSRARAPVATMMFFAASSVGPCPSLLDRQLARRGHASMSAAHVADTVILFFFIRP